MDQLEVGVYLGYHHRGKRHRYHCRNNHRNRQIHKIHPLEPYHNSSHMLAYSMKVVGCSLEYKER